MILTYYWLLSGHRSIRSDSPRGIANDIARTSYLNQSNWRSICKIENGKGSIYLLCKSW